MNEHESLSPSVGQENKDRDGKMFRFGMFALQEFKGRLWEWPQYSSHVVQIPHLGSGYMKLVADIENGPNDSVNSKNMKNDGIEGMNSNLPLKDSTVDQLVASDHNFTKRFKSHSHDRYSSINRFNL